MYYDYGVIFSADQPNCVRNGDYNGAASPYQAENVTSTGTFTVMRNHSQRERIIEIDDRLLAAGEEYLALSGNLSTASETVKTYVQDRIVELKDMLLSLERERSRLLAIY